MIFSLMKRVKLNLKLHRRNPNVETDARVIATLSTQISDKITINGKFGVPVGGVRESAIIGDVEVQLQLNEDGSLKARVFNRENDISNNIGQGIGYTQGLGLTYEVDFNTFKEFINKLGKGKKQNKTKDSKDEIPDSDSDLPSDFIRLSEDRQKKNPEKQVPPVEKVPDPHYKNHYFKNLLTKTFEILSISDILTNVSCLFLLLY
jgi:hypothetical protein